MGRQIQALAFLAVAGAAAWVLVPAFPAPHTLIHANYAVLQSRFGAPTDVFPDKFVGWSRSRLVAKWTLKATLHFPLSAESAPTDIQRCLWIPWAGYTILCTRLTADK